MATQVNLTVHLHPTHVPDQSGAARYVRERVYKNTIALCVRGLCFKTALAKFIVFSEVVCDLYKNYYQN